MKFVFIDTNILVYLTYRESKFHHLCLLKFSELSLQDFVFYIAPQIIKEYGRLLTSSKMFYKEIQHNISIFLSGMKLLEETESTISEFVNLLHFYNVNGKSVYDCNIAAVIKDYRVKNILTHNVQDFGR